jgi:hypothetical protein
MSAPPDLAHGAKVRIAGGASDARVSAAADAPKDGATTQ